MRIRNLIIVVFQIRIQRDSLLEGFNGFGVLIQTLKSLPEKEVRIRIVWLELRSFLQIPQGIIPIPLYRSSYAQVIMGEELIWMLS